MTRHCHIYSYKSESSTRRDRRASCRQARVRPKARSTFPRWCEATAGRSSLRGPSCGSAFRSSAFNFLLLFLLSLLLFSFQRFFPLLLLSVSLLPTRPLGFIRGTCSPRHLLMRTREYTQVVECSQDELSQDLGQDILK